MSKVIIAGSRTITDYTIVADAIEEADFEISEVVSGKADGVDSLGEKWAKENNTPVKDIGYKQFLDEYPPNIAPIIRNERMAEYADCAIIIWNGKSSGTEDMIETAEEYDLDIHLVRTDNNSLDRWLT